jgi:hypothetical protein
MSTDPPSAPEPLDLDAIHARAQRHARLERHASRDITLAEVSAAIHSADDVPVLLAEVRRLRRAPRLIREAAVLRQSADLAEAAGVPDATVAILRRRADELDPPPPTAEEAVVGAPEHACICPTVGAGHASDCPTHGTTTTGMASGDGVAGPPAGAEAGHG